MQFKIRECLRVALGLALVPLLAVATLALTPQTASADRDADITFTKWVTDTDYPAFPWDMKGVVGGKVGLGTFTGEVLTRDTTSQPGLAIIHALYHINGGKHALTADLRVIQSDALGTAVLRGVVISGWAKGGRVEGQYKVMADCPMATPGNIFGTTCFQGALDLDRDARAEATFTKWVTDTDYPAFPWDMKGVVGGDVGDGSFSGEVLTRGTTSQPGLAFIHALYHINGGTHSLTADLRVVQSDTLGTAEIEGVVSSGWQKGSRVQGEYTVMAACPMPTPGNIFGTTCFQGTIWITLGSSR